MDTVSTGKPYFTIEIGDSSGWHNIPLKPMPISKMIKGKEIWLEWAKKNYSKVHTIRAWFKRRKTKKVVFSWNKWEGFKINESALPPGFEGFSDSEIDPEKEILDNKDKMPEDIQRDSIVQIGRTKWIVWRRASDYTVWVYKHPSAKRKAYEITSIGNGKFEVWQTGGSGQRLKSKPEVIGEIK